MSANVYVPVHSPVVLNRSVFWQIGHRSVSHQQKIHYHPVRHQVTGLHWKRKQVSGISIRQCYTWHARWIHNSAFHAFWRHDTTVIFKYLHSLPKTSACITRDTKEGGSSDEVRAQRSFAVCTVQNIKAKKKEATKKDGKGGGGGETK